MSAESNKSLVQQFLASWNCGDVQAMARHWAPDMVHHTRTGAYGPSEVFSLIGGFMQSFPDLQFQIEDMVAEGDFVATRMTARATHRQDFMGVPASGKQISCSVMGLIRVADGKIAEHWNIMDELYLLQQIGLVPDGHLNAMASS
jgi:C-1 hydroxylase